MTPLLAFWLLAACAGGGNGVPPPEPRGDDDADSARRAAMVADQLVPRGVRDPRVLEAMRSVPRHRFVPDDLHSRAYTDGPLAIGAGQTISQPYIVALMTELVHPDPKMKVLEVGTGSGYQAAVLARCVGQVYTIEIVPGLGRSADRLLRELGYTNIEVRIGDGFDGWPDQAPFDAILVTAAPDQVPKPLLDQLAVGGRLVIPVGSARQELLRITRTTTGYLRETIIPVRFVPMTGKAQQPPAEP